MRGSQVFACVPWVNCHFGDITCLVHCAGKTNTSVYIFFFLVSIEQQNQKDKKGNKKNNYDADDCDDNNNNNDDDDDDDRKINSNTRGRRMKRMRVGPANC